MLEARSRDYVERRVRAGVLEQGTVDLLDAAGVGARLRREGSRPPRHRAAVRRRAPPGRRCRSSPAGGAIVVYGQTEVVKDLIEARLAAGHPLLFEVERRRRLGARVGPSADLVPRRARRGAAARVRRDRRVRRVPRHLPADDSGRGPADVLARVPVRLARHPRRGRAVERRARLRAPRARLRAAEPPLARGEPPLHPVPARTRTSTSGPDDRIWEELQLRLGLDGWTLAEGPVLEKGVTGMRSFVVEPMQHGRLFLAGDAAHIVPPTGAKGLNLAIARREAPRRGDRRAATATGARTCSTGIPSRACAASGAPSISPGG